MELSSYSAWRGLSVWQLGQRVSACEMNASGSKSKYSPEQSTLIQQQSGSFKEESPRVARCFGCTTFSLRLVSYVWSAILSFAFTGLCPSPWGSYICLWLPNTKDEPNTIVFLVFVTRWHFLTEPITRDFL